MATTIPRKDEYTVSEVADILQVHAETVRRLIRDPKMRPKAQLVARNLGMGTGGGYRISHEDLERFVKGLYPYLALDIGVDETSDIPAEPIPHDPQDRATDLKAVIKLLEPLYRDYTDRHAPTIRAHTAALRKALRQMQE